jgi:hypothetical protein
MSRFPKPGFGIAMRPTRKIIAEFIAVFLIGAGVGGLVTSSYTDTQLSSFMSRTNNPDYLAARINKRYVDEYHLSPDELNRIQPDIKEMAAAIYRVRHRFGIDIVSTLDRYHQQIADKLTPEHRAVFEKAVADHKLKLDKMLIDQSSPDQGGK